MAVSLQTRTRKNGNRYTATVRRAGHSVSASFWQKRQAELWGRRCEDSIDTAQAAGRIWDRTEWEIKGRDPHGPAARAEWRLRDLDRAPDTDPTPRADWTLHRALTHYEETVTPKKKGAREEGYRLRAWRAHDLAHRRLNQVTRADVAKHVQARTQEGRAAVTVRNDVFLISALYRTAALPLEDGGWGLDALTNPVHPADLPKPGPARQRRLQDAEGDGTSEEGRLRAAILARPRGQLLDLILTVAIETGMRLSETVGLARGHLRRSQGIRSIETGDSKNGDGRRIVLSSRAAAAIDALAADAPAGPEARLIPLSKFAVQGQFRLARQAAGLENLRLHDLRHEGISRMADAGLTIGELQAQSGHRTAQILLRYVNARAVDVSKKLG